MEAPINRYLNSFCLTGACSNMSNMSVRAKCRIFQSHSRLLNWLSSEMRSRQVKRVFISNLLFGNSVGNIITSKGKTLVSTRRRRVEDSPLTTVAIFTCSFYSKAAGR